MRIDSNGSVYIASVSDSGSNRHFFQLDGFVRHKRANLVGDFDRDNTDGDFLKIRKDGSDVGTFGSNSGQFLIDSNASNVVIQANSGSSSVITRGILRPLVDNTDDLGLSNRRFQDLHLSGVANVGGVVATSTIRGPDGSATAASFNSINDINTGLFIPAANNLAVTTDGTERVRIDASGRVGIGTTAPGEKLEVAGNVESEGLKLNVNTSMYTQNASLSYYSSTNAVYLNGAGNNGWLRLNAVSYTHLTLPTSDLV